MARVHGWVRKIVGGRERDSAMAVRVGGAEEQEDSVEQMRRVSEGK